MSTTTSAANRGTTDAFLQPESMVTPGALGALVMLITNSLAPLIELDRRWIGLLLAFVFGSIAIVKASSIIQKSLFYIINSLIIFSVAAGTNQVGLAAGERYTISSELRRQLPNLFLRPAMAQQSPNDIVNSLKPNPFFSSWFGQGTRGIKSGNASITKPDWSVIAGSFVDASAAKKEADKVSSLLDGKPGLKVVQLPNEKKKWGVLIADGIDISTATARRDRLARLGYSADTVLVWNKVLEEALPPPSPH
jgi:SPOR domain